MKKHFNIYSSGLCFCSICTNIKDIKEITKRVNLENPTGMDHKWQLAKENFRTGDKNPSPCNINSKTHKHYLFDC